ncbi:MAG: galactokinase [Planctomycetes bacterium]|nr:galactokinase [Planctomycetota bacterium]
MEAIVRAPGRVNLIGEHTDYNGLPVLPFAIDRSIRIGFAPRPDGVVHIRNVSAAFPERSFETRSPIPPSPAGDWVNYVKAGVQGVADLAGESIRGFDARVEGDIPPDAGLSSSTALVVASALAACEANEIPWEPIAMAERLARAERYVGTEGGGMDQAACLGAREGHVLRIDFAPLRVRPVSAPPFALVVAQSLVSARKTAEAREAYNRRVAECRLAAAIAGGFGAGEDAARIALEGDSHDLASIARKLGMPAEEVVRRYLTRADGTPLADPQRPFLLLRRFLHVVQEARRVERACEALERGDLEALGAILDEGHASLRDLFEVSCPEVDELCRCGREAGALGSRMTGAGFGGSTIHLLRPGEEGAFRARLDETFYRGPRRVPDRSFAVRPAAGAEVIRPASGSGGRRPSR